MPAPLSPASQTITGTDTVADIRARYQAEGYLVMPEVIAANDLQQLRAAAAAIVADFDINQHRSVFSTRHRDADRDSYFINSAEAVHCFLEEDALDPDGRLNRPKEQAINKIGHAMHDLVPAFTRFCQLPVFADALQQLGVEQPELWQSMYIFKQPEIGGEVRWHQDASYLRATGTGVIGCWVALEDATLDNGCLWLQPGGHRSPLRELYSVAKGSSTGVLQTLDHSPWPDASQAKALPVAAGSVIWFHDHMPHYSSRNTSVHSRQAFTMHFTGTGGQWSAGNWLQRHHLPPFRLGGQTATSGLAATSGQEGR